MTHIDALPERTRLAVSALGYYSIPHIDNPRQTAAVKALADLLNDGPVEDLPAALGELSEAFSVDANGHKIAPSRNWTYRMAYAMKSEVEIWLTRQRVERISAEYLSDYRAVVGGA